MPLHPRISGLFLALTLGVSCQHTAPEAAPAAAEPPSTETALDEPPSTDIDLATQPPEPPPKPEPKRVLTGIDVLQHSPAEQALLEGEVIGLVTNTAARDRDGRTTFELLVEAPWADVQVLFTPEHGFLADVAGAGTSDVDSWHGRSHGLFSKHKVPTPEMLEGVDVLVFDMQSVGVRFYTYLSTMVGVMGAARDAGIPMIILDRPNPIAPQGVGGNVLDPAFTTFVGILPLPWRYELTLGEMARYVAWRWPDDYGSVLHVVRMEGWDHDTWFDETDLAFVPPSPAMLDLDTATSYPGFCLLEGTNIGLGRGTPHPFQMVAAPWLDAPGVVDRVSPLAATLGAELLVESITPLDPTDGKYDGVPCEAVRVIVTDRERYDPIPLTLELMEAIRALHAPELTWHVKHFDRLAGTDILRESLAKDEDSEPLLQAWEAELLEFERATQALRLYYP